MITDEIRYGVDYSDGCGGHTGFHYYWSILFKLKHES